MAILKSYNLRLEICAFKEIVFYSNSEKLVLLEGCTTEAAASGWYLSIFCLICNIDYVLGL